MKKEYINPETYVQEIEMEQVLELSIGGDTADGSTQGASIRHDNFEYSDEEFEELW